MKKTFILAMTLAVLAAFVFAPLSFASTLSESETLIGDDDDDSIVSIVPGDMPTEGVDIVVTTPGDNFDPGDPGGFGFTGTLYGLPEDLSIIYSQDVDNYNLPMTIFDFGVASSDWGFMFLRTNKDSSTVNISYENRTEDPVFTGNYTFEAADVSLSVTEDSASGTLTFDMDTPRRGFFTPDEMPSFLDGDSVSHDLGDHHGSVSIARVLDRPYFQVMYTNYGGPIPYGTPAGLYPLIRRDLMPYRFADGENLDIDLGTVFVQNEDGWPNLAETYGNRNFSYSPEPDFDEDDPNRGHSIMVKVTNWGSDAVNLELDPITTGIDHFYLSHGKFSCDSDWPAWGWNDYFNSIEYGDDDDFGNYYRVFSGDVPAWDLSPAFSVNYWAGRFDNVHANHEDSVVPQAYTDNLPQRYDVPLNRTFAADGEDNTFFVEMGDLTFNFTWKPKHFNTLELVYPREGGYDEDDIYIMADDEEDQLTEAQLWYAGWNAEECDNIPETPDYDTTYQGSGVAIHLVSFDIEPSEVGDLNPVIPNCLFESGDYAFGPVQAEDGNVLAMDLSIPFSQDIYVPEEYEEWIVPREDLEIPTLTSADVAVMPMHVFLYMTQPVLDDIDPSILENIKEDVANDVPLDEAFLAHNHVLFTPDEGVTLVDLVQAVEDAGKDPTNFIRVLGTTDRMIVHFFVVVADTDESGVEVGDGYFIVSDGNAGDSTFTSSFGSSSYEAPVVPRTSSGGGSCNVGFIPLSGAALLLPLLMLLKK